MIVRAADLKPDGRDLDLRLHLGPLGYAGGLEIGVGEVRLATRVVPSRGGIRCGGRLEATASVPCARCLEPFPFRVEREFDLQYLPPPRGDGDPGAELQVPKEELDVAYLDEEGSLDMNGLAAEQIYLALPMKPLCADACRGLCAGCGANLNTESCYCAPAAS